MVERERNGKNWENWKTWVLPGRKQDLDQLRGRSVARSIKLRAEGRVALTRTRAFGFPSGSSARTSSNRRCTLAALRGGRRCCHWRSQAPRQWRSRTVVRGVGAGALCDGCQLVRAPACWTTCQRFKDGPAHASERVRARAWNWRTRRSLSIALSLSRSLSLSLSLPLSRSLFIALSKSFYISLSPSLTRSLCSCF